MKTPQLPLLSVITVNLNNCQGLTRTLASIEPLRSTHLCEFIFIDGCSVDDSLLIASRFYPPEFIISETDAGVYDAMNKGLALANGSFCYWLNSGDEFLPQCWDRLSTMLLHQSEALLACGTIPFASDGREQSPRFAKPYLLPHSSLNHQSLFFRTKVIRQLGGYQPRFGLTADRELILRLLAQGHSIKYEPLTVSRYELGGLSSNLVRMRRDHLRVSHAHGLISPMHYWYQLLRLRLIRLFRSIFRSH